MGIQIRLLGRFQVTVDGQTVPARAFAGRTTRTMLRLLACHRGNLVTKDFIGEAIWGDRPPGDLSASIDVLASRARRVLGDPALLVSDAGGLILSDTERIDVDAEILREAVVRGRHYLQAEDWAAANAAFQEALAIWGGEPLPDDAYADWAATHRQQFSSLHLEALEGGSRAALMLGDWAVAVQLAHAAVSAEPLREMSNMLLVTALARTGDQVGALEAFKRYRRMLADELGLDPSSEAYEIENQILRGIRQESLALLSHLGPNEARPLGREALSGSGSAPMRARTLASMAMLAAGSDDYMRASELIEMAMPDARRDQRALAEVLYVASIIDMNLGQLERSRSRADEALSHFELLGDAHGIANILDGRAMAIFMEGRVEEGVAAFDRVARLFEKSTEMQRVITPRSTRGHGLVFMDRAEEGLGETESALALARSFDDREGEAYSLWHTSEALSALDRFDDATRAAQESLDIAEKLGHREWTAAALRALGIARQAVGTFEDALAVFTRGAEISSGVPLFETWHTANAARVLVALDRLDEAGPWVQRALSGGPPLGMFEARLAEVELARAEGRENSEELARRLIEDAAEVGYQQVVRALT
jgi:DNA-binding SARP family transcriptional activator